MNLNNDKFLILDKIKKFILSLEKVVVTFPKKDIISRNMIYNDALELLELVIKANYENDKKIKHNYQINALAKIHKIDFYLERAYHLKYISERICQNKGNELLVITKMIYKWCQNER